METASIRQLSCVECRRRKAKCDRSLPCSNCTKHRRSCNYDRLSRTPLTRKYVSDIENELHRTRDLLARRRIPESTIPTPAVTHPSTSASAAEASSVAPDTNSQTPVQLYERSTVGRNSLPGSTVNTLLEHQSIPSVVEQHSLPDSARRSVASTLLQRQSITSVVGPSGNPGPTEDTSPGNVSTAFSLETPPQTANFDWDERHRHKTRTDDRGPDGMAGLGGRHSRGYMGVASGAAFLRLADTEPEDSGHAVEDQDGSDESVHSISPSLNSVAHLEPFVDAYFQTYHLNYPIVHESTFRAQFMEIIPRPRSQAWQVLLHIIAAVGAFASSETAPSVDQGLFDAAKARLSIDMLETGNLMLVQALTLISNYVQKRNKPNSGYSYMGLAKRMAMGIGLHKEFPAWQDKPLMLEIRRRVWWCLYNFDVGAIITFSRPLDLPKEGIEVQLPLNVTDMDVTPSTTHMPVETQATTLYTHLRSQAKFHLATAEIYSRMIALPYPTAEEMILLDDLVLTRFGNDLPAFYQEDVPQPSRYKFPHAVLHWRLHNFRILLFRAFVLRNLFSTNASGERGRERTPPTAAEDKAVRRCFDTAGHTIRSITSFWAESSQHNVLTCWYSLYFLFQAVLIPVVAIRNRPSSSQAGEWKTQIRLALAAMADMATLNPSAVRCQRALDHLCGRFLGADSAMSTASSFDLESPQTQLQMMQNLAWPMADTFEAIPLDMSWYDFGGDGDGFAGVG